MDAILVRCKTCQHAMKFSAEKAGKRAKCPKCDTVVLIKAEEENKPEPETAVTTAAAEAPAPAAAPSEFDADPHGGYDVFTDPELEQRRLEREAEDNTSKKGKNKDRKKLPKMGRKVKAIPDAESWDKVRIGLLFVNIGTWFWFAAHLLQGSYVLLGSVEFSEYAVLIAKSLEMRGDDLPPLERFWDVDELDIHLGMIAGRDFLGYARMCMIIASVCYIFQALLWIVGYCISLPVPPRFGARGQLIASLSLGGLNFFLMLFFKLLPVFGAIGYIMVPFLAPEICMTEYNMERAIPIHLMWSGAPFWESFGNILLNFSLYLQPTMACIFLWSVGIAIKDSDTESGGHGLTQLSLGAFFVLFAYHMLALCGASPVLIQVLRVFYTLWYLFLLLFILRYALVIQKCRAVLYEKINPKNELES